MADKEIVDEGREKFSSRLGFILISAGCAIGLGNIWRFPYITGEYGGAAFVLLILFFLVVLGVPLLVMEFAMGRASYRSLARSYEALEPQGSKWHRFKWLGLVGCYLLMMFYAVVCGWTIAYFVKAAMGTFDGTEGYIRYMQNTIRRMTEQPCELPEGSTEERAAALIRVLSEIGALELLEE